MQIEPLIGYFARNHIINMCSATEVILSAPLLMQVTRLIQSVYQQQRQ